MLKNRFYAHLRRKKEEKKKLTNDFLPLWARPRYPYPMPYLAMWGWPPLGLVTLRTDSAYAATAREPETHWSLGSGCRFHPSLKTAEAQVKIGEQQLLQILAAAESGCS